MFDFRQLRYFVAVAQELSFTRAAQQLHISQPPLSQQIQALERGLGVQLLARNKRNVALTEPGRVFLEQARAMLAKADEARAKVTEVAAGFSGILRLAYTVSASFHPLLPQSLLRYDKQAPNVRLHLREMHTQSQFSALRAEQIDVGFVRALPTHDADARALRLRILNRETLVLALPSGHQLAGRDVLRMHDLAGEKFVAQPRELSTTLYDRLVQLAVGAGFQPNISQEAQQLNGLLCLVAAGIGLALVPASLRVIRLAGVSYVPLEDPDAYLLLAIANRVNDASPALAQFIATAVESMPLALNESEHP